MQSCNIITIATFVQTDAGKVAVAAAKAKAAIEGATHTNLAVADTSDAAQKWAAVQAVVDSVKGTKTAVVTADGANFSVAISLNAANAASSTNTATFVSNNTTLTTTASAVVTDITGTLLTVASGTYTQALVNALVAPTGGTFELQNANNNPATLDLDTTSVVNTSVFEMK